MNDYNKLIIVSTMIILSGTFIFVPYEYKSEFIGYSTIYRPAEVTRYRKLFDSSASIGDERNDVNNYEPYTITGSIDYKRLLLQDGAIIMIAAAAVLLIRKKKGDK